MVLRVLNFKKCCDMSCLPMDNDWPTSTSYNVMVSNLLSSSSDAPQGVCMLFCVH